MSDHFMGAIRDRWMLNRFVKILLMIGTFYLAYAIPPKFYWIVFPLVIGLFMIIDIGSDDDSHGDGPAGGPVDFSGDGNGDGGD